MGLCIVFGKHLIYCVSKTLISINNRASSYFLLIQYHKHLCSSWKRGIYSSVFETVLKLYNIHMRPCYSVQAIGPWGFQIFFSLNQISFHKKI